MNIGEEDVVCFCFGEIDCRCQIKKRETAEQTAEQMIYSMVSEYERTIAHLASLHGNKLRLCIEGITPPVHRAIVQENPHFPFIGTDEERLSYTNLMNALLVDVCKQNNWVFFDMSKYADEDGFLSKKFSDDSVHVIDPIYTKKLCDELMELS